MWVGRSDPRPGPGSGHESSKTGGLSGPPGCSLPLDRRPHEGRKSRDINVIGGFEWCAGSLHRGEQAPLPDLRDVFLCHAWDDRQGAAKELHDLLESRGVRVWFSEKDVALGTPLLREIDRGLLVFFMTVPRSRPE